MNMEVKDMKRLLSLVLVCCILLPLCASAETIKEQINAPETCQAEYFSNTGRTKITVAVSYTHLTLPTKA